MNICGFNSFLSFLSAFTPNVEIFKAVGRRELCLSTQTFLGKRREMKFPLSPKATIVSIEIPGYKLQITRVAESAQSGEGASLIEKISCFVVNMHSSRFMGFFRDNISIL